MGLLGRLFGRKKDKSLTGPKGVRLTRDEALRARLMRNEAVAVEEKDSGDIVLSVPIVETRMFRAMAWLMRRASKEPVPSHRKVELDEIGSFVWRQCDGKTTVEDLVKRLSRKYKLPRKEAEYSTTMFVRELAKKQLVALGLSDILGSPGPDGEPDGGGKA